MGNVCDHIRLHALVPHTLTDGICQTFTDMVNALCQLVFIALILAQVQLIVKFSLGDLFDTLQDFLRCITRCEK